MKPLAPLCFAVTLAFALFSRSLPAQDNDPLLRKPLQPLTPSKRGVVFKSPDAREFGKQCSRQSPTGWWSSVPPSKNEIKALEKALPNWIQTHHLKDWKPSFQDFHYQYGALTRGKKRLIYVNASPDNEYSDSYLGGGHQIWRRVPLVVCDGGNGFWGIEYDVASKGFQNVSFNGPA